MSGIAGWIDWEEDLTHQGPLLKDMVNTLAHRGPDAQGQWLSPRAALAHCRLKIIDPEGGSQPMVLQMGDRLYAITYNGEIYNFRELRHELEERGHIFRTHSDTEVLLHAFVEWGTACVNHLNGMFAFALWDESQQQLLLARDHMGVKPLYYAQRGSAVLFGSELKALLAHPLIKAEVDVAGLTELFSFRPAPGSCVYRDVYELRAAHLAVCNHSGVHITRYWSLQSLPHTDDLATTAGHVRELLEDAVRHQLVADVPVVSLLSGGLDSSCLTMLAAREFQRAHKQLHTYSIEYVHNTEHFLESTIRPSEDEPWVKKVAGYAGTMHHTISIDTSELLDALLVPLYAFDLPVIGQMATSLYLLFKILKQHATVVLSGESADEIFGGYPWFHSEAVLKAPTFPWFVSTESGASQQSRNTMIWLAPELLEKVQQAEHIAQQYQIALAEVPRLEGYKTFSWFPLRKFLRDFYHARKKIKHPSPRIITTTPGSMGTICLIVTHTANLTGLKIVVYFLPMFLSREILVFITCNERICIRAYENSQRWFIRTGKAENRT